jgi:hypothetical protein
LKSRVQGELYQARTPENLKTESGGAGEFRLGLFDYNPGTVPI